MADSETKIEKKLNREIGKAIHRYNMIKDGDRILVGVSGGKDSMTLLFSLAELKKRAPVEYSIIPVHIDPGFDTGFSSELKEYCRSLGMDLIVRFSHFRKNKLFTDDGKNPCFVCSKLRRKFFFDLSENLKCTKIALGHNQDDLIETFFVNMMYAGQISTMLPRQSFFDGSLDVIRPLSFLPESTIRDYARIKKIPVHENPCPYSKTSKRSEVRTMLDDLFNKDHTIRGNIFRAMRNVRTDYMLK